MRGRISGGSGEIHYSARDIAVEIYVEWLRDAGAGTLEGAHLPYQGQGDWERRVGGLERDMKERAGVYYRVYRREFISSFHMSELTASRERSMR